MVTPHTVPEAAALPAWDAGALVELEDQERALRYPDRFGAAEALTLGCAVAALADEYDRGVTAEIVRASDGMLLFAWSQDDKAPRNYTFTAGKRRVAEAAGHSSLWVAVAHQLTGAHAELCDFRQGFCPVGGAVPIVAGAAYAATLAISGLHEGKDHELAVRALARALGLAYGADVRPFSYRAV